MRADLILDECSGSCGTQKERDEDPQLETRYFNGEKKKKTFACFTVKIASTEWTRKEELSLAVKLHHGHSILHPRKKPNAGFALGAPRREDEQIVQIGYLRVWSGSSNNTKALAARAVPSIDLQLFTCRAWLEVRTKEPQIFVPSTVRSILSFTQRGLLLSV